MMKWMLIILMLLESEWVWAQEKGNEKYSPEELSELELLDEADKDILNEVDNKRESQSVVVEDGDDLLDLKDDLGEIIYEKSTQFKDREKKQKKIQEGDSYVFDTGEEEFRLSELSKMIGSRIPKAEWDEVSTLAKTEKYKVVRGDTLWDIALKIFGSGFYYAKIWSLNPYISNPHEIEPGMVLVFDTGDDLSFPKVGLGTFSDDAQNAEHAKIKILQSFDLSEFADDAAPSWLAQREEMIRNGTFFQYASEYTYDDLVALSKQQLLEEYKKYAPPASDIVIQEPGEAYDSTGFDKNSRISFSFKEGFFLNTFISSNIVIDLGEITDFQEERIFLGDKGIMYVRFADPAKIRPGDLFSVYSADGKSTHFTSDREGYRYTVVAQIEAKRKINDKWECHVIDLSGLVQRLDRITVYTPKIGEIFKTFNPRNIEAIVMDAFKMGNLSSSFGDVIYLDRGRADGVELGNVFDVFSSLDRGTNKRITLDPTYKIAELTVITLTDNFATALVTQSSHPIPRGALAVTKSMEDAARAQRVKEKNSLRGADNLEAKALDQLDVELNLDDISDDLLKKADSFKLTEDELEELERQEREKSVIKDHEKDLRELERLETEIGDIEQQVNEARVDEDKLLEQENLDALENRSKGPGPNAFGSMDEIEAEIGKKYLDEDLNARDNPYGLTEYDLEEVDELLNTGGSTVKK